MTKLVKVATAGGDNPPDVTDRLGDVMHDTNICSACQQADCNIVWLKTYHVVWAGVLLNPDCCLSLVVLSCGLQQLALKVLLVAGHLAHSNLNEDAQDVLQQSTVNLLTLSLELNQLQNCISGFALHL